MKAKTDKNERKSFLGSYKELITAFLESGYKTEFFTSDINPERQLLLRHDIDFDCGYAAGIAAVENKIGVKATYFFLLRSDSYNLLSKRNYQIVREIKNSGHEISLHFDPLIYGEDFLQGFRLEREIFEKTFETELKVVSIHRPNDFFLNFDETLDGVEHTYQKKYFRDIKYISDSQGVFRFGHPLDSEEFKAKKTIHLLTHPVWWQGAGESNMTVLQNHIVRQEAFLHEHISENCKPYRDYLKKK